MSTPSNILDKIKMIAAKAALPLFLESGKESAEEALIKLYQQKPKKFAVLLQSVYPVAKGVLVPFFKWTKNEFDDPVGDTLVDVIEDVAKELNITLPTVEAIDFNAPDEPEETPTV